MIMVYAFAAVIITAITLFAFYIFFLIRPKRKKLIRDSLLTSYAHRGLHGNGIPENSISAFEKAIENGFGIELDVQLSSDLEVFVFHDYSLARMTGVDKMLSDTDANELGSLLLYGTEEAIPTFKQVLKTVDGRVPLLIELKGESLDSSLCEHVAKELNGYGGPFCIESFNPFLLRKMKQYLPDAVFGQLYTNVCRDKKKLNFLNTLLTLMAFNFVSRPDFIAYNKADR